MLFPSLCLHLAVLAVVATVLGWTGSRSEPHSAQERARQDLRSLRQALLLFGQDHGAYPDALSWHLDLVNSGEISPRDRMSDPWGQPYHFSPTRDGFVILSAGRDGLAGTCDDLWINDLADAPESRPSCW